MAVTKGSPVKFVYIGTGKTLPASPDPNTIYLDEPNQSIWLGSALIADHLEPTDIQGYNVKDIDVSGTGNNVSNITLDYNTKHLQITKSNLPTLSKGTDTTGTPVTLTPGGTFTAMTDTSVSDHTITDQNTTFTLPAQMSSVVASVNSTGDGILLTITNSDSTTSTTDSGEIFGDMAFEDSSDYMTVTDGATKEELEELASEITGAMHYKGVTSTAVTDGGTETATIDGEPLTAAAGDVVLYQAKEFIWSTAWHELGDGSSYALKTVQISAGTGLTGGGTLSGNVTLTHQAKPTTGSSALPSAVSGLEVVSDVIIDTLGHVKSASKSDLATSVNGAIDTKLGNLDLTAPTGDYITSVSQADGQLSATAGTKGAILQNNSNLVDGGTVYTAIETAKEDVQLVWDVVE